jgi:hypothetical protein
MRMWHGLLRNSELGMNSDRRQDHNPYQIFHGVHHGIRRGANVETSLVCLPDGEL